MSKYDYDEYKEIERQGYAFYGLLMALMRQADTHNLEVLKAAWPDVWAEMSARYYAPGGILPEDCRENEVTQLEEE